MQNAFTHALRQIRPNRVFLPTSADLHPDHQIVHEEVLISLFHAQGNIWPELGKPIAEVPKVYEFACYCDFPQPPQIRIETPPAMLEAKLNAISAYASQEQIESVVAIQRNVGSIEYLRELEFHFYRPAAVSRARQLFFVSKRDCLTRVHDAGKICYLGDDDLQGAAAYLGGIMSHHGLAFDYVPSSEPPPASFAATPYALYVVSDYPAATFRPAAMLHVAERVRQGAGLAMFGGWESFFGRLGEYHAVAAGRGAAGGDARSDDRRNSAQPACLTRTADHPILDGLAMGPAAGDRRLQRDRPSRTRNVADGGAVRVCRSDGRVSSGLSIETFQR